VQFGALEWSILILLLLGLGAYTWWRTREKPLPSEWPLAPRPLFSGQEEQVYQFLCNTFPEHLVLAKVPLARFMRLKKGEDPNVWFPLINPLHVSFIVCTQRGYVIAALDLPAETNTSASASTLKLRALQVCGIKYMSLTGSALPTAHMLRTMLLGAPPSANDKPDADFYKQSSFGDIDAARAKLDETIKNKRSGRDTWSQDSIVGADTFISGDSRLSN
jgi:Protein of unknown function (DUF2726)